MIEQTFVIIKPDAIGIIGKIISRFEDMGLGIERIETHRKNEEWCAFHYAHIKAAQAVGAFGSELVYQRLEDFMAKRTIGIILSGPNAISRVHRITGATNALEALPGTIRGDFGNASGCYNLIHASDSVEAVKREIELYFNKETDW